MRRSLSSAEHTGANWSTAGSTHRRLNAGDVATVSQLGHGEGPCQLQRVELWQDALVVLGGAQLGHCASTQGEVHACLDGHGVVGVGQGLEVSQEAARVCGRRRENTAACSQHTGSSMGISRARSWEHCSLGALRQPHTPGLQLRWLLPVAECADLHTHLTGRWPHGCT